MMKVSNSAVLCMSSQKSVPLCLKFIIIIKEIVHRIVGWGTKKTWHYKKIKLVFKEHLTFFHVSLNVLAAAL